MCAHRQVVDIAWRERMRTLGVMGKNWGWAVAVALVACGDQVENTTVIVQGDGGTTVIVVPNDAAVMTTADANAEADAGSDACVVDNWQAKMGAERCSYTDTCGGAHAADCFYLGQCLGSGACRCTTDSAAESAADCPTLQRPRRVHCDGSINLINNFGCEAIRAGVYCCREP